MGIFKVKELRQTNEEENKRPIIYGLNKNVLQICLFIFADYLFASPFAYGVYVSNLFIYISIYSFTFSVCLFTFPFTIICTSGIFCLYGIYRTISIKTFARIIKEL